MRSTHSPSSRDARSPRRSSRRSGGVRGRGSRTTTRQLGRRLIALATGAGPGTLADGSQWPLSRRSTMRPRPAAGGARELVFTTEAGALLRSSNFRRRYWLDATKACDLMGLRVHDLRHTAASLAVKSGTNPKVVQQMLG